jgi:D-lactate dehydrogenase (cytochrome)
MSAIPSHSFSEQQLVTDPVALITYEIDAGFDRGRPDAVFYPDETADVSRILQWASANQVPLIARGAGTGLAGGAVAKEGGVVLVFSRMNRLLELDTVGQSAVVQAGAVNLAVDAAVKEAGLYYPPDPSSGRSSLIGGNLGTNAGGPHCFKYGVTTNYVTGLEVVLAGGDVVILGGRALDYPEYDFCGLMVGSEGTLGVITQANLRLIRNPPGVMTMMVAFESEEAAGAAVSAVIAAGLVPATLEMMDQRGMRIIEEFAAANLPVDAGAALIVEVDGYAAGLHSQVEEIADLLAANGGKDIRIAQSEAERQQIWYGRKSAAGALARLAPTYYLTDVTVRRSLLGEVLHEVKAICTRHDVITASFFHAGDGNLHPLIPLDPNDPDQVARVHQAAKEIIELCIRYDGSITGEHGVGVEKRPYMAHMYSGAELAAMRDIKEVFDPANLLNPGKVLPDRLPAVARREPEMPGSDPWQPKDAAEAAAGLLACTVARRRVLIGGVSVPPDSEPAIRLETARLTGVQSFAPEDLFVTVGAGMAVDDVQDFLAEHGFQAPVISPWPGSTVGGILSGNIHAPSRMRYGSLRDAMLCATVAMADGRIIRAGRPLVKNVAGYDLPKVFVGARGTLGLLTDVTLKLTPVPRCRRTLVAPVGDLRSGLALARAARSLSLLGAGIALVQEMEVPGMAGSPYALLYTIEGVDEDVAEEAAAVAGALRRAGAPIVLESDLDATAAWQAFLAGSSDPETNTLLVRMGLPVKELATTLPHLPELARQHGRYFVDYGAGLVYFLDHPPSPADARLRLNALRHPALAAGGYALIMAAGKGIRQHLEPWGYHPTSLPLMRKLKERWDPAGILNSGVFLV